MNEGRRGKDKGIPTLASSATLVTQLPKGSCPGYMFVTSVCSFVPFQWFFIITDMGGYHSNIALALCETDQLRRARLGQCRKECAQLVLRMARLQLVSNY